MRERKQRRIRITGNTRALAWPLVMLVSDGFKPFQIVPSVFAILIGNQPLLISRSTQVHCSFLTFFFLFFFFFFSFVPEIVLQDVTVAFGKVQTFVNLGALRKLATSLAHEASAATEEVDFSFAASDILNDAIVNPVRSANAEDLENHGAVLRGGHQRLVCRHKHGCCPADWAAIFRPDDTDVFFNATGLKLDNLSQAKAESQAHVRGYANHWRANHRLVFSMPMTRQHCELLLSMSSATKDVALWSIPLFPPTPMSDTVNVAVMLALQQVALSAFVRHPTLFKFASLPTTPCPFDSTELDAGVVTHVNGRVFKVPKGKKERKKKKPITLLNLLLFIHTL
jgi:hypothetical protein